MTPTTTCIPAASRLLARRAVASSVARTAARAAGTALASRLSTAAASTASTTSRPRCPPTTRSSRWSGRLSYASPESDFCNGRPVSARVAAAAGLATTTSSSAPSWSDTLSFTSPESDFTAQADVAMAAQAFPSSSSDTASTRQRRQEQLAREDKDNKDVVEYDTRRELLDSDTVPHDEGENENENDRAFHFHDIYAKVDAQPLPHNLAEAMSETETRAIVVTETSVPFRVVAVNAPWEGLCGYTQSEARGQTLGDMLGGPDTNEPAVTALLDTLLHGEEAGTVLTNYAKDGRKFQNRLRVGELKNDGGTRVTHFVGVLREIAESPDRFETTSEGGAEQMKA